MRNLLVMIWILLVFWGCHKAQFNDPVLNDISKQYPLLELNEPVLTDSLTDDIYNNIGPEAVSYYYKDTLQNGKIALMCVFKAANDSSYLHYYTQIWEKDGWNYELKIADDTLYSFRSRRNDVEFLVGEYEFRRWSGTRTHPRLSQDEQIYYDLHRDSLRKVRGNNLPPLPTPTDEERKKWEEMQAK